MARKTRIQIAKPDILSTFESVNNVLSANEISEILSDHRDNWRLTQRTNLASFIDFLESEGKLVTHTFKFPRGVKKGYSWGNVDVLPILNHIIRNSYISHYTALMLNGLTNQEPKTIYITQEQSSKSNKGAELEQEKIDSAFKKPARVSSNTAIYRGQKITLLYGSNTNQLGVEEYQTYTPSGKTALIRVTGLERTLIDAAVRPSFSGGVFEVARAYKKAKNSLSVTRLAQYLKRINYIYPYHQVIGFYLDRSGYDSNLVDIFRRIPQELDFYLAHNMQSIEYVKEWRLFIPKGF